VVVLLPEQAELQPRIQAQLPPGLLAVHHLDEVDLA
jgi:hypothetical protein